MNIFKFRDQLIDEYRSYVTSFIRIADPVISRFAEGCFSKGALWPDPLIQLNPTFKPGKTIRDVVAAIDAHVKSCGYIPRPPYGHICGVDLIEARVSPDNGEVLLPGTAVILHPTVFTPDSKNSFFWGETYLVTDDGFERLHHASDELITVSV